MSDRYARTMMEGWDLSAKRTIGTLSVERWSHVDGWERVTIARKSGGVIHLTPGELLFLKNASEEPQP